MNLESFKKYSTGTLSDALDSLGVAGGLLGLKPQSSPSRFVGRAFTVQWAPFETAPQSFQKAGDYIDDTQPGEVVVIDNAGRDFCTNWGGILTEIALKKGLSATLVHGAVRDVERIRELGYPLFSRHCFMQSGKNRVRKVAQQIPVTIEGVVITPGDILCGDESGCVVIPQALAEEVLLRAQAIEETESKILAAALGGMPLSQAREKFHYHEPWKRNS